MMRLASISNSRAPAKKAPASRRGHTAARAPGPRGGEACPLPPPAGSRSIASFFRSRSPRGPPRARLPRRPALRVAGDRGGVRDGSIREGEGCRGGGVPVPVRPVAPDEASPSPRTEEPSPRIPPRRPPVARRTRERAGAPWSPTGASDARRTRPDHPRGVPSSPSECRPPPRPAAPPPRKDKRPTKQLFLDLRAEILRARRVRRLRPPLRARRAPGREGDDAFHAERVRNDLITRGLEAGIDDDRCRPARRRQRPAIITHARTIPGGARFETPHHRVGGRGVDVRQGMGRGGDPRGAAAGRKGRKGRKGRRL